MTQFAVFGIDNGPLNLLANMFVLFLVALYFALVVWTYLDARRRIADGLLVGCATVAALFPFFGSLIYLVLRPPELLEDARERDLEIAAAEARLLQLNELSCPHCRHAVERAFLLCPNCHHKLKERCLACGRPLDPRWPLCPYCEHQVGQPPPRRRRAAAPAQPAGARATGSTRSAAPARESAPTRQSPPARQSSAPARPAPTEAAPDAPRRPRPA